MNEGTTMVGASDEGTTAVGTRGWEWEQEWEWVQGEGEGEGKEARMTNVVGR